MIPWPRLRFTAWGARQQAWVDARCNYPPPQAELPLGYARELEHAARNDLALLERHLHHQDRGMRRRVRLAAIGEEAERQRLQALIARYSPAEQEWGPTLAAWLYLPLMLLLLGMEVPFNAKAFEVFRYSQSATLGISLGVSMAVVLLSHFVGVQMREPRRTATQTALLATGLLLIISVVAGVAGLRHEALSLLRGTMPATTLAFVAFQVVVAGTGVVLSYLAHDPLGHQRRRHERACGRLDAAMIARAAAHQAVRTAGEARMEAAHLLHAAYEGENMKHRRDGARALPALRLTLPAGLLSSDLNARTLDLKSSLNGKSSPPGVFSLDERGA